LPDQPQIFEINTEFVMSYSPKNNMFHSHLIKQPSFKHSLMAALVITLGGTSLATWAGETVTTAVAPTTAKAPVAVNAKDCANKFEQHPQDQTQRRTEIFQQADSNKDGKVNLTEWLAFQPQHRGFDNEQRRDDHSNGEKNLSTWLQKVDTNHDGQISKAEAESYAPRLAKHFAEIDSNHNGLISPDELKASQDAHTAKWQEHTTKNRTEAFEKADTNHDGQLTLTEWLAFNPHDHGFWHHLWHRWFGDHDRHSRHEQREGEHQGPRGNLFKKVDTKDDGQNS
jgi:Ca2+-binding EF-hand superfamily protein